MSKKYPRSLHLPFSPGGTNDDKRLSSVDHFLDQDLVLTEKMDGSNVCLESAAVFARSHSGAPKHPSFDALKQMHASIRHLISEEVQVFGEWCYARHSIAYDQLPGYLLLFGIRHRGLWCSWDEVQMWAEELGVPTVPELARSSFSTAKELQEAVEGLAVQPSKCGGEREGVVVRRAGTFWDHDFPLALAKWVRKGHVQTDDHWSSQAIVKNILL
jgi:hypothetical protein